MALGECQLTLSVGGFWATLASLTTARACSRPRGSTSHSRRRCSSSWEPIVLEWIAAYVVGKTVNATLGDSIDTALRAVLERTIAEFKERYPN